MVSGISPKDAEMTPADSITSFREPVCDVVRTEKHRGVKAAIQTAARIFDLPERRVRACWHDEVREVLAWELDRVRCGYRRWKWDRRMKLAVEIERLEAELREMGADDQ